MGRTQTLVQLNERLLDGLDRAAAQRGVSRSQVIREAVEQYLDEEMRSAVDEALLAGYARSPQQDADDWGQLHDDVRVAANLGALEAEEDAAGMSPWRR